MSSFPSRAASQNACVWSSGVGRSKRTSWGWCHDDGVVTEPGELLVDQLRLMAAHVPDEVAFACLDDSSARPSTPTELTFAAWESASNRLGRGLVDAGIAKGDRVALYITADEAQRWFVAYAAIHKAGAVAVPLNTRLTRPELQALLGHAETSALVCSPLLAETAAALAREVPSMRVLLSTESPAWDEALAADDST